MNTVKINRAARARYRRKTPDFLERNHERLRELKNPLKKLEKILRIIETMRAGKRYTAKELTKTYQISLRAAYRYMKLIEAVGIIVEQDFEGRFYIVNFPVEKFAKDQ